MLGLPDVLGEVLPDYEIPEDDLVGEVLIPAMRVSEVVRIGAGFFSVHCLAQIAPGLAAFIHSDEARALHLLISPEIGLPERRAIEQGVKTPQQVIDTVVANILHEAELSESALVHHTLDCLAYLVATDRLVVRFVLMRQGMYHKKKWLFRDRSIWAAVHGSGNATARGLLVNGEQMTVDRPWMDGDSAQLRVERMVGQWERQWSNKHPHSLTLSASQGLRFAGRHASEDQVPTVDDFWAAWRADHAAGFEPALPPGMAAAPVEHRLRIPRDLEWRTGDFSHQGVAVDRFLGTGGRGILAIATGGGKTRTALIAATQLQDGHDGSVLVVVLVPSKPLMLQWAEDVEEFGLIPFLPSLSEPSVRKARLAELEASLSLAQPRTEVIVATNNLWSQPDGLASFVDRIPETVRFLLIGDEVHNLGAPAALASLPERADWRLGLSATPIRQYDPDGTDELFAFFGEQIFEFDLAQAIAAGCLTPYDYHLHEVTLTELEMDKWVELTEELRQAGFAGQDEGQTVVSGQKRHNRIDNPKVERLLRERRAILEQAEGKLVRLREILTSIGATKVARCLIYASAKPPILEPARQINQVNGLLSDLGIIAHQFTSAETSRSDAQKFLVAFGRGDYQVLTAMKVLDEGIDIPQTDTAFLLASSTVRREWVQRRGRILRKAGEKTKAALHDFLVLPPDPESKEGRAILKGELRRADEFTSCALNEWVSGGPRTVLSRWEDPAWLGG